jgi:RNA polymerase sigma factor FliA
MGDTPGAVDINLERSATFAHTGAPPHTGSAPSTISDQRGGMAISEQAGRLSAEQALDLWLQYKRTGDSRLRDRLVLTFAPMVKYIVYRKIREMPSRCEVDDFISCGLEALIKSIDRYDPEKGATLEQFAWTRIHGAVLDELRRNDWAPRSLRRSEREIGKARDTFFGLYGRRPNREELADALGVEVSKLVRHQNEIARASVGSLNALVSGEDDLATERIDMLISEDADADPESVALSGAAKERFREAFECLAPRERKIAVLLYVYNLTLREIGEILGVTESRVCQLHAQILSTLRARLSADEQLFTAVAA